MTPILGPIRITYDIMEELDEMGFARLSTSKTMLTVSKNAFKGLILVDVAY